MAKPRVTATDRLADVIEVVELGRRTGLLMVERGAGEMLEEGAIFFQDGRAIYAGVERVRGQDALAVLGGWGACRFSFDPQAARPAPNLAPSQPASPTPASQDSQHSWSGSTPGYYRSPTQAPQRGAASPPSWYAPPSQPPTPSPTPQSHPASQPSSQPTGPFSASWPDPRFGSQPGIQGINGVGGPQQSTPTSGSLPLPYGWSQPGAPITGPVSPNLSPTPQAPYPAPGMTGMPAPQRPPARAEGNLLRRPRRAPSAQTLMAVVQRYGLSRAHRTLLMLADGEHNVIDIARLSSKQIEEVQALLGELEGYGLVYYQ